MEVYSISNLSNLPQWYEKLDLILPIARLAAKGKDITAEGVLEPTYDIEPTKKSIQSRQA